MGWTAALKGFAAGAITQVGTEIEENRERVDKLIEKQTKEYSTRVAEAKKTRVQEAKEIKGVLQGFTARGLPLSVGASFIRQHGVEEARRALLAAETAKDSGVPYDKFFTFAPNSDSTTTMTQYVNSLTPAPDILPFLETPGVKAARAGNKRWWNEEQNERAWEAAAPTGEQFKPAELEEVDVNAVANYKLLPTFKDRQEASLTEKQRLENIVLTSRDENAVASAREKLSFLEAQDSAIEEERRKMKDPRLTPAERAVAKQNVIDMTAASTPPRAGDNDIFRSSTGRVITALEESLSTSFYVAESGPMDLDKTVYSNGKIVGTYNIGKADDKEKFIAARTAMFKAKATEIRTRLEAANIPADEISTYIALITPTTASPTPAPTVLGAKAAASSTELDKLRDAQKRLITWRETAKKLNIVDRERLFEVRGADGTMVLATLNEIDELTEVNDAQLGPIAQSQEVSGTGSKTFQIPVQEEYIDSLFKSIMDNEEENANSITQKLRNDLRSRNYNDKVIFAVNKLIREFDKRNVVTSSLFTSTPSRRRQGSEALKTAITDLLRPKK